MSGAAKVLSQPVNMSHVSLDDDSWNRVSFWFSAPTPPRRMGLLETAEWRVTLRRNGWWRRRRFGRMRRLSLLQSDRTERDTP